LLQPLKFNFGNLHTLKTETEYKINFVLPYVSWEPVVWYRSQCRELI